MTDRYAVVTGASRGIGRAVAIRLATDGATVLALGRDASALEVTAATVKGITTATCDVTDAGQIRDVFGSLDRVDILVNNAGIAESNRLERTTDDQWSRHLAVNATGPFLCSRAVLPGMRERDWGRIVTVASVVGLTGASYISAYAASKHAVIGLSRSIAAEVAGTGITANAVCPTYVRSDMTDQTIANIVAKTGMDEQAAEARLTASVPLGRLVEPEEVAHAVAFLASQEAAPINGQSIILDGGGLQQ